jgi:hypothetical protein
MDYPDLNDVARRPARYWNADGVPELTLGLMWIVWGAAWLIGMALPHRWPWNAYWLIVTPLLATSALLARRVIRGIKERVTFPRTGYVAWKQPEGSTRTLAAAAIVVAALALAALLLVLRDDGARALEERLPPILAVGLSLSFLALSVRQRAPHYLAFAAVAIAMSLATASLVSGWSAISWTFVALGVACAVFGAGRLARFVRDHPRASMEGL